MQMISDNVMESIEACVFGLSDQERKLEICIDGKKDMVSTGTFARIILTTLLMRNYKMYRLMTDLLDEVIIG